MTARAKKLNAAYEEIMTALYANSEPSADFRLLVEQASVNDQGQKVIDFNSYEIDYELAQTLYNDVVKKYKIKNNYDLSTLGFNIWLGASPRFKRKPVLEETKTN